MQILVVDDSAVARLLLSSIFVAAGHQVLQAKDGYEALALLQKQQPDIVTMDVHMPGLNGFQTIVLMLEQYALPVIVLTADANAKSASTAIQALACGALAVLEKPTGPTDPEFSAKAAELLQVVQLMAQVQVVKRSAPANVAAPSSAIQAALPPVLPQHSALPQTPALLAIAASAGGPAALKLLLPLLDNNISWPVLLVQHITHGFLDSFTDWLRQISKLPVHVARQGQTLLGGNIYLPPDGFHLECDAARNIRLLKAHADDLCVPSANRLFLSLAQHHPTQVVAVQLSGMGLDGANGIKAIVEAGGMGLVQDPATALIDSMPKAALQLCKPQYVESPQNLAWYINSLLSRSQPQQRSRK
ncbi:chemotaxis protein CheB [Rheinheimera riviphila]|uniref:protein-glutamate methylesterase n=1 Tax=Rheinheimera riviphila TaxID=1834037 RepID=A0A437QF08_9GAMM|nr:chemotaxis protein CheB [Rheinheimera riviphila]RVU33137.1 chemotaxis protein CheB [Rheinheimera riviphila]